MDFYQNAKASIKENTQTYHLFNAMADELNKHYLSAVVN